MSWLGRGNFVSFLWYDCILSLPQPPQEALKYSLLQESFWHLPKLLRLVLQEGQLELLYKLVSK